MSDHEHDHEHNGPPPSLFAMLGLGPSQEQIDLMTAQALDNGHQTRDFLMNLDADQLVRLHGVVRMTQSSENFAFALMGNISMLIDQKFGKCIICGDDHDAELAKMSGQVPPEPEARPMPAPPTSKHEPFPGEDEDGKIEFGSPEWNRLMDEYNVETNVTGAPALGFKCSNCGTPVHSLEDRMLRAPGIEGCDGCVDKEKWG